MLAAVRRVGEWLSKKGKFRHRVAVRSQLAANTNCDETIRSVANVAKLGDLLGND
jgi:hypothetical protein